MAAARWTIAPVDEGRARALARAVGLSPLCGRLLLRRGIETPEAARPYLEPRLAALRPPLGLPGFEMAGFEPAVARLERAITVGETIGVFGDYDVDGVTSAALLTTFLRQVGARVETRVARREAGYGLGVDEVAAFDQAGCALLVTCDCGTSDHAALAEAAARGLEVIIVDHHQVPTTRPQALALLNPHQTSCRFPYKGLASVGVAFYLAAALRRRLERLGRSVPDPRELLDLVALGTICDMAPLTRENRILVAAGLAAMARAPRPGVAALASLARIDGVLRSADIGQRLGPRLNAPGRLGAADAALALLLAETPADALARAEACEEANRRRREVQGPVVEEALAEAELQARAGAAFLVVAGEGWHPGVVGIVAARLVDRFGLPAAVLAIEGDTARGSLRAPSGASPRRLDLHATLGKAADLLVRWGGHAAAAGLTVERSRLDALRERLSALAAAQLLTDAPQPVLELDAELDLGDIGEPLVAELARLEPFGVANPEPLFAVRQARLSRARVVGDGHLQVTLGDGLQARDGIGFGLAEGAPALGSTVRAAVLPEIDTWQGVRRVRVRVKHLEAEPLPLGEAADLGELGDLGLRAPQPLVLR